MIGALNFFGVSLVVANSLFGISSPVVLTIVDVLVEIPVMSVWFNMQIACAGNLRLDASVPAVCGRDVRASVHERRARALLNDTCGYDVRDSFRQST